jgi:hypothetical protein
MHRTRNLFDCCWMGVQVYWENTKISIWVLFALRCVICKFTVLRMLLYVVPCVEINVGLHLYFICHYKELLNCDWSLCTHYKPFALFFFFFFFLTTVCLLNVHNYVIATKYVYDMCLYAEKSVIGWLIFVSIFYLKTVLCFALKPNNSDVFFPEIKCFTLSV